MPGCEVLERYGDIKKQVPVEIFPRASSTIVILVQDGLMRFCFRKWRPDASMRIRLEENYPGGRFDEPPFIVDPF